MPSTPPPYARVRLLVAAAVLCSFSQPFIFVLVSRVGSAPWRYECPYAGEYGLRTPPVGAASAVAGTVSAAASSAEVPSRAVSPRLRSNKSTSWVAYRPRLG